LNGIVLPWRRSVSTAPNDVQCDKVSVLFWSFFTTIESEESIYDCIIANFTVL